LLAELDPAAIDRCREVHDYLADRQPEAYDTLS
jgi:hypothetical protein